MEQARYCCHTSEVSSSADGSLHISLTAQEQANCSTLRRFVFDVGRVGWLAGARMCYR
jgi:hypothetical protein